MKMDSITIQGFRGFNGERTIVLDEKITLIHARNSYGKTSISEAVEWLLYGSTSKVDRADYKEEYKGSYRNTHLPAAETPFVCVTFRDAGRVTKFRAELLPGDDYRRYIDDTVVDAWPFSNRPAAAPKPFILQHALKNLLLAKPDERFHGFAQILGLTELDTIHQNVVSLCTKPGSCTPHDVAAFLDRFASLQTRASSRPALGKMGRAMSKGLDGLEAAYAVLLAECKARVAAETDEQVLPQLLKLREEAVGKFYSGRLTLKPHTPHDREANSEDISRILGFVTDGLMREYMELRTLAAVDHVILHARFLDIGLKIAAADPAVCPFCGQTMSASILSQIEQQDLLLQSEVARSKELESRRAVLQKSLSGLREDLVTYYQRNVGRAESLVSAEQSIPQLEVVLVPKHEKHFNDARSAISLVAACSGDLQQSFGGLERALTDVEASIAQSEEKVDLIERLAELILEFVDQTKSFTATVDSLATQVSDADQILKRELDILASMQDISILIELLEEWGAFRKKCEIEFVLASLKDLRRTTDRYVADRIVDSISQDLTLEVMRWYGQIKTQGDPDVHFAGFDLERTAKGDPKPRRVRIMAKSYGKDLVSAVSSLSESKLNALGLSMSIATNLGGDSPFEFLVIDDPIQSWDADHEVQFIEVIKELVGKGKQLILLSHNENWLKQVRDSCRSLNGRYYQVTGYTQDGPHFTESAWAKWAERLEEVDAIVKDPSATSVKLQQAEEEIRIALAAVASDLYFKRRGERKSAHDLNGSQIRKMLIECGVDTGLVNRVLQTFGTTDPAHHAQDGYTPNKQRVMQYHSWVHELAAYLK